MAALDLEEVASYIFLAMAAQLTKSEGIFSLGRRTVTDVRAGLSRENVENHSKTFNQRVPSRHGCSNIRHTGLLLPSHVNWSLVSL